MLAELAAANAAFQVIKTTIQNGKEIHSAGKALSQFLGAKEEIEREANKKRARGVGGADLEEFMALEKIREQEKQLKEIMIYAGRPGMWKDYQKYCEQAKDGRAAARKAAARKKAVLREKIGLGLVGILLAAAIGGLVYIVLIAKGSIK
tara:strand:+ start:3321 stop:3767 length:447 start_codon:yes stop_codon:yes gene_type:complete